MTKFEDNQSPYITFLESTAPGTPASGLGKVYVKSSDSNLYFKNDGGTESQLSGAAAGAPSNADYLVGTANGSLSAEIVVGTSPGGELGGTWASPTVDAVHSGSSHISNAGLIAKVSYGPGTPAAYVQTSATLGDADATNLIVTFTTPASGNILVRLTGTFRMNSGAGVGARGYWGIRESTTIITGPTFMYYAAASPGANVLQTTSAAWYLTGISAGSHSYKWAIAGDGTYNSGLYVDAPNPALMEIWAA